MLIVKYSLFYGLLNSCNLIKGYSAMELSAMQHNLVQHSAMRVVKCKIQCSALWCVLTLDEGGSGREQTLGSTHIGERTNKQTNKQKNIVFRSARTSLNIFIRPFVCLQYNSREPVKPFDYSIIMSDPSSNSQKCLVCP